MIELKKDLFHSTVDFILYRGEARGEAKVINALLDNDFTLDEICAMTKFDKSHVLDLLQ